MSLTIFNDPRYERSVSDGGRGFGLDTILRTAEVVALTVIAYGVRQSRKRSQYKDWLASLIRRCLVLAVDVDTTDHYAEIRAHLRRAGTPIPVNDLWIAALARQHALPVLSRNRHFDNISDLRRIGW